jgi:hypothetical protein
MVCSHGLRPRSRAVQAPQISQEREALWKTVKVSEILYRQVVEALALGTQEAMKAARVSAAGACLMLKEKIGPFLEDDHEGSH